MTTKQKLWFAVGLVVMAIFGAGNADAECVGVNPLLADEALCAAAAEVDVIAPLVQPKAAPVDTGLLSTGRIVTDADVEASEARVAESAARARDAQHDYEMALVDERLSALEMAQ